MGGQVPSAVFGCVCVMCVSSSQVINEVQGRVSRTREWTEGGGGGTRGAGVSLGKGKHTPNITEEGCVAYPYPNAPHYLLPTLTGQ